MSWTDPAITMTSPAPLTPAARVDPTPTLDATLGGPDANSYVTLAEADAYFAGNTNVTDWNAHSDALKEAALIQATQWMDYLSWSGDCCGSTQRLSWPRKNVKCRCREAVCTEIPFQVKQATYELAFKLVHDPDVITGGVTSGSIATGAVKRNKLADLEQEFFAPDNGSTIMKVSTTGPEVLQLYPFLVDILGCWYGGGKREIRLYRN